MSAGLESQRERERQKARAAKANSLLLSLFLTMTTWLPEAEQEPVSWPAALILLHCSGLRQRSRGVDLKTCFLKGNTTRLCPRTCFFKLLFGQRIRDGTSHENFAKPLRNIYLNRFVSSSGSAFFLCQRLGYTHRQHVTPVFLCLCRFSTEEHRRLLLHAEEPADVKRRTMPKEFADDIR